MKIALCLSGYLRTFKDCYSSILKNVILDNECDIFIHTYDKIGVSKGWRKPETGELYTEPTINGPYAEGYREFRPSCIEETDIEFLETIPYIKTIVIERLEDIHHIFIENFTNKGVSIFSNINEIANVIYKIYKCNELKKQYENEHNFKYDLVIRTRGDQIFTKPISYNFNRNKILINSYPWGDEDFVNSKRGNGEELCLSDRFAVGTSENIDYLSNLYLYIEEYFLKNKITFSPIEQLLKIHLDKNKIEVEKRNLAFYVKHTMPRYKKP